MTSPRTTQFKNIFKEFPYFNYIQSKALDDLLYTDRNFVISAPTGSGKTVIFELAITRLLMEVPMPWSNIKIVYMAPIKALCSQRFEDWKEKFGPIGLICKELTGDTLIDDLFEMQHAHIIMTTPEKWDSMTRKWRDNTLVQLVSLFLIDEVHVVKDESRGATLEVVVSRMKTIQSSLSRSCENPDTVVPMRFVAVSATIPNAEDIAEWLSHDEAIAICLKMDEMHRPVKLRKVVLGFPSSSSQTEFKFDLNLNYKISSVIQTYSDQKPTLVFCATRKGVQQAASVLSKDAKFIMSAEHKQRLLKAAKAVKDCKLRDLLICGIGYHHAGVDIADRKLIEGTFTVGDLPVLFTTSTLAMGVNLPAHLVVIKSTMHYASGMFQEYSETDILQMIGRAGRPQFDTTATAVIMTRLSTREKYVQMLNAADTIESSLHRHLIEHLNAEIVLHTITDVNIALEWIRSTFLYIRALKNPVHYGFPSGLDRTGIEAGLQELCLKNLNDLSSVGLIRMDEEINFKPSDTGRLMALYYITFDTVKQFCRINGTESLAELVTMVSNCNEFSDVQLRTNEKKILNTLNKDKNRIIIRYPMEGKIKTREMKVNCLIQACLGCIPIQDFSLTQDIAKIFRSGTRVTKCLSEFLASQENKFSAFLNSLILAKCFRSKLWENSPYISKQLEKIGVTLSNAMVNAGLMSFKKIEDINARELELIVNRHPPFGNQIKEAVTYLPKYELGVEQTARYSATTAEIIVTIALTNYKLLQNKRTAPDSHYVTLVIGDADNQVVYKQKVMDSALLKTGSWTKKVDVKRAVKSEELSINVISSEYVGLDIQQKYTVFYTGPKKFGIHETDSRKSDTCDGYQDSAATKAAWAILEEPQRKLAGLCAGFTARMITRAYGSERESCDIDSERGVEKEGKIGIQQKTEIKAESPFSSYLTDLRNRNALSSAPSIKRLKMSTQRSPPTGANRAPPPQLAFRLPEPPRFDGTTAACRGFLNQCQMLFEMQSASFPTDRSKITYIISLLSGSALAWASPLWEQQDSLLSDLGEFLRRFRMVFDVPGCPSSAASELLRIQQGSSSVGAYAIQFRTLAAELKWNQEALTAIFWQGLNGRIKDELAGWEVPSTLDALISLCVRIDVRFQERAREQGTSRPPRRTSPPRRRPMSPQGAAGSTAEGSEEPMVIGRHRLSAVERAHRRNYRLCLYCGKPGHFVKECPNKPGNA
ncbi:putative ATP-dependent DNA helicase HFM1 [Microcaecilia unicolor]|uniref:Probable ATP-dependent DNA helicase HFM1 n=1 Tax=Microcaecilia unicolor TaxID=1415580 RepID=A0A6P7YHT5_9AMPH|nr:probable ATP-dependent DNA helicase HFM1 [Microcaecilia unicolor]